MKLHRLELERVDGLPRHLEVDGAAPGLNVVAGANASGKSTLAAVVRAMLWPDGGPARRCEATALWENRQGVRWEARLLAGEVTWEQDGQRISPPPVAPALAACTSLSLADLLRADGATDGDIAAAIVREMYGGYDLRAARDALGAVTDGQARAPVKALAERRDALREVEQRFARLATDEDRLAGLQARRQAADAARQRLDVVDRARELGRAEEQARELRARRDALPPAVARLTGNERQQLATLRKRLADDERDLADARAEQEQVHARQQELGLGETPLPEITLAELGAAAERLKHAEEALGRAGGARQDAAAKERALRRNLLVDLSDGTARIEPDRLDAVERALGERSAGRERLRLAEARLQEPPGAAAGSASGGASAWIPGAAVLLAGLVLAALLDPGWLVVAIAGAFLLGIPLGTRRRKTGGDDGARARAEQDLADLRQVLSRQEQELAEACARAGLDAAAGELALRDLVERLRRHGEARLERDVKSEQAAAAEQARDAAHQQLARALDGLGLGLPLDGALPAVVDDLRQRSTRLRELLERWRQLAATIERATGQCAATRRELAALFTDLDLAADDEPGLTRLLDQLEPWGALERQVQQQEGALRALREQLEGEEALVALDAAGLEALHARLEQEAADLESLIKETERIRTELALAGQGHALQDALTGVAEAEDALATLREQALLGEAGALLLEQVETAYEEHGRPEVLRRAQELFARFTRQAWRLELDRREDGRNGRSGPRLAARESASQALRQLEELSDGTRIQLLLAARVAFALSQEGGEPLPLFLDEALSTADPQRFEAVADALLELVAGGRQVFYLTANPDDLARWRGICAAREVAEPVLIDLGTVRREAAAITDPQWLLAPASPAVPAPDGLTAGQYGVRLAVPRPEPFAPAEALHLFHVLRDDLPLLDRLLRAHLNTVGEAETARATGALQALLPAAEDRARLVARAELARAFVEAWQVGRGRPADRAVLEASGAVSGTFLDAFAAILTEHGGSAAELLATIEGGADLDPRVKFFRSAKLEELRAHLEHGGHLVHDPPLDEDALVLRVLGALQQPLQDGLIAAEQVREAVLVLSRLLADPAARRTGA